MKKVSKAKVIFRAFTSEGDLKEEVLNERRSACAECPFSSDNKVDLGVLERVRKATFSEPFCTICGCQIHEKTSQGVEVCPDSPKRWKNVYVDFSDEQFDIVNLSYKNVFIDVNDNDDELIFNIDPVTKGSELTISFIVESVEQKRVEIPALIASCSACTTITQERLSDYEVKVDVSFETSKISLGETMKTASFIFGVDGNQTKGKMKFLLNIKSKYS